MKPLTIVAAIGMIFNGDTAWLFMRGQHDLNICSAFLHMAADAEVSAGVILVGLIILITGWLWIDPVVSLLVNAVIIWSTWGLLTEGVAMTLNAIPSDIEPEDVCAFLRAQQGVADVHDLHIWPMSPTETAEAKAALSFVCSTESTCHSTLYVPASSGLSGTSSSEYALESENGPCRTRWAILSSGNRYEVATKSSN